MVWIIKGSSLKLVYIWHIVLQTAAEQLVLIDRTNAMLIVCSTAGRQTKQIWYSTFRKRWRVQSLHKCCSERPKTAIYFGLFQELWNDDGAEEVTGPISVIHQFVDMPSQKAEYVDPVTYKRVQVSIEVFPESDISLWACIV
jgi:hypothetical protein